MSLRLNQLNERQRQAVLHGEGPLLVLAGAGSGKTSTMAYRIAHLIAEKKVPAGAILGLSFTRKAAEELRERVKKLVTQVAGKAATQGLTVTTFHSLCARILRVHAERIGYQKNFTILDQNDQGDVLRDVLRNIKVDDRKFDPDSILFQIGQAKNRFLQPAEAEAYFLDGAKMPSDYAIVTASAFGHYQQSLRALNALDFDDLLFLTVELLKKHADVREAYGRKFRQILVDEYQDTNQAQFKLLRFLTESHQNLCVVGDDDQSIYAWRGADPTHILGFAKHYPAARTITLDQNYRSTTTILDAANGVIGKNRNRHPKSLWSDRGTGEPIQQIVVEEDRAEAEVVGDEIVRRARTAVEGKFQQVRPWKDFAILYRSNAQSRLFEEALRMRQVPYKIVGGMSFLDRKEVKNILAYWRLVVNPRDDASARRIVNWPARGIGKTAVEALGAHALAQGLPFFDALGAAATVAPRSVAGTGAFREIIAELRRRLEAAPSDPVTLAQWARQSFELIGAKRALEEESDDPAQAARKWENVEELANSLGQLDVAGIIATVKESGEADATGNLVIMREYLTRMLLEARDEEDDKKDKDKDKHKDLVTLLTLHGAKGLEYPIVFLVGMEEGFLPHKRTLEEGTDLGEERRLCYVGITRARDHLILTRAKHRVRYGKKVPRYPSRFVEEIPANLIVSSDESSTPDLTTKEAQEKHEVKVKDFLSAIRAQISG